MLPEIHDMSAHPMSTEMQGSLYQQLSAMGGGHIREADLLELLHLYTQREKADHLIEEGGLHLELADPEHSGDGDELMRELTEEWDEVRLSAVSTAEAPLEERMEHFRRNLNAIARIQAAWSRRAENARRAHGEGEALLSPRATPKMPRHPSFVRRENRSRDPSFVRR